MSVGVIGGTGPAGRALAGRLASVGHTVVIGSRSPERARAAVAELNSLWPGRDWDLSGADNAAAAEAEVAVIATPWDGAVDTVTPLGERLSGKVVVSMANALLKVGRELQALEPPRGSIAASVQAALPGSRVVAALHHVPAHHLGDLDAVVDCDVVLCGDHPGAVAVVGEMLSGIPLIRAVDAGSLSNAGAVEAFTAVLVQLNATYRTRVALRFTGLDAALGPVGEEGLSP